MRHPARRRFKGDCCKEGLASVIGDDLRDKAPNGRPAHGRARRYGTFFCRCAVGAASEPGP